MRVGCGSVIRTILLNNRLKCYEQYIIYAKNHGYNVISLEDFYKLKDRKNDKHFVLRHDVDLKGPWVRRMFEIEKKCHVKSTYYFRFSTVDKALIDEMIRDGFDVGFHFETISDWAEANGVTKKEDISIESMKEILRKEILEFEAMIGQKIYSICSHGASKNIELKISNNVLTEDADMNQYGVAFEAYDKKMYKDIDCHIMDQSIILNGGFAYSDTPISAVDDGFQNIVFLAHPNHWYFTLKRKVRLLGAIILGKGRFCVSTRKFKRIML